jgi:hypothetical protein
VNCLDKLARFCPTSGQSAVSTVKEFSFFLKRSPFFSFVEGMNPLIQLKAAILPLLITFTLSWFVLAPVAQARQPTPTPTPTPPGEDRGNGNSAAENVSALNLATTGANNTAHGWFSLFSNTTGSENTANGVNALVSNATGVNNTALGVSAGSAVATANNVTCIGANVAGADVSNTTWIGNVYGNATLNAQTAPVVVSVDGQLATVVSSERFKKDIATMEKASEVILSLRPVTFR